MGAGLAPVFNKGNPLSPSGFFLDSWNCDLGFS